MSNLRTPLKTVRGLGSAKEGADHFWLQRITAVANLFLMIFLVTSIVMHIGKDYATVKAYLAQPIVSIAMLLMILAGVIHMRLGMQVVIEDYVHSEAKKIILLMLNTFFCVSVGLTCIYAVLKLGFGA
ncbi:MAG: succinate dehydrogenase, hydrophobic membrane anchor protein [Methyloligellaceae bacterium]